MRDAEDLKAKSLIALRRPSVSSKGLGFMATHARMVIWSMGVSSQPADMLDVSTDHRVAMTGAVLAMACAADAESSIDGFDVASVSYPEFLRHSETLGARIEIVDG